MFKTIGSLLVSGLLLFALPVGAAAAVEDTCAAPRPTDVLKLDTFEIDLDLEQRVLAPGERVRMNVSVERKTPARTSPTPAAGVSLTAALAVGDLYLVGYGRTDDAGRATISIRTWKNTPATWGDLRLVARKPHLESPCHEEVVEESVVKLSNAVVFR